jgi:hypothetical protein
MEDVDADTRYASHTEEFPECGLRKKQLVSFFSIAGDSGKFSYTPGRECVSDNWYKHAIGDG